MYNINDSAKFYGYDLGGYKDNFCHNLCDKKTAESEIIWQNVENNSCSVNFIVRLKNGKECAGTLISEGGWVRSVYVVGLADIGEYEL